MCVKPSCVSYHPFVCPLYARLARLSSAQLLAPLRPEHPVLHALHVADPALRRRAGASDAAGDSRWARGEPWVAPTCMSLRLGDHPRSQSLHTCSLGLGVQEVEACPPAADLERQCLKCNDRKSAADAASLDSDRVRCSFPCLCQAFTPLTLDDLAVGCALQVFMCLYLKDHPSVVDARVISIGNNSFTAYEPRWGLQKMIYADRSGAVA